MGKGLDPERGSNRFRAFTLDAARELVPRNLALVWELVQQDEVVAVCLNFVDSRTFYWNLGGFASEVTNLGLGKIAVGEGIRSSIARGRTTYDFMRGSEAYKYWPGAEDRHSPSLIFHTGRARPRTTVAIAGVARRVHAGARRDRPVKPWRRRA